MADRPAHTTPLRIPEEYWRDLSFAMPAPLEPTFDEEVLADAPFLYWKLGATDATTVTDVSGNGRHGIYVGTLPLGAPLIPGDGRSSRTGIGYVGGSATGIFSGVTGATVEVAFRLRENVISTIIDYPVAGIVSEIDPSLGYQGGDFSLTMTNQGAFQSLQARLADAGATTSILSNTVLGQRVYAAVALVNPDHYHMRVNTLTGNANSVGLASFQVSGTPTVGGRGAFEATPVVEVERMALYATTVSTRRLADHYTAFERDQRTLSRGVLGTTKPVRFLGPPQQWVFPSEVAPYGYNAFTVLAVCQPSLQPTGGARMTVCGVSSGSDGVQIAVRSGAVEAWEFDGLGSSVSLTASRAVLSRLTIGYVHGPSDRRLYVGGRGVASATTSMLWFTAIAWGVGADAGLGYGEGGYGGGGYGGLATQTFSGAVEQVYILNRALAAWEVERVLGALA